ncbi:MAG: esterase [Flavobacteriaceae bacterium]|nr:esterase [Flavobacteriaceae bacterium]
MRKNIFLLLILTVAFVSAQKNTSLIVLGTNYVIDSKVLNQEREIQIYLPDSYHTSKEKYPVLYVLDGQWFFTNGVAIQKSLRTPGAIPEMIVVGIKNSNPLRRTLFNRERSKFTSFLKEEVIGFVDSSFRTTKERIIYGWEAAAYYVSKLILEEKELFTGAIVSDGGWAPENAVENFKSNKEVYFYMANSKKDIYYVGSSDAFNETLMKYNPKNLRWKYELFNDEVHETLPHLALYKGIKYYYHNYDALVFSSIQQFNDLGGLKYVNNYFKERTKRFGADIKSEQSTQNSLIWLAWKRDNFKYFSFFMEEFKDVLKTRRYASAYWQNRLGQFYLKHKDYKNAIKFFETGIKKYPNTNFQSDMEKGLKEAKNKID